MDKNATEYGLESEAEMERSPFKVKRLEPAEINFGNLEGVLGNPINYDGDSIQTHLNRIF